MLFFAQYFGAKDDDGINRAYGVTSCFMMAVGLVFACIAVCLPGTVMNLYTDKTALHGIGIDYLSIVGFSYPLSVFSMTMAALLRTTGKVRIPLIASVCSVLTNIALNALLIPLMGVKGAALATVIASFVNCMTTLILGKVQRHPYLLAFRRHYRWTKGFVKEYLKKCAPIIANELLIGVSGMIINVVLGRQSEQAIAALAVFRTLEGVIIGFFAGFTNAASVLVGTEVGAGHPECAWQRAIRLVHLCMLFIGMAGAVLVAVNNPLLHAMGLHDESYRLGFGTLVIYCIVAVIRMGNWVKNDTFRSAGDATFGTVLEILFMYIMVLPLVCLSGLKWNSPFLLVFGLAYVDEPIRFVLMHIHLYRGTWIRPVTSEGIAAMPAFRAEHHLPEPRKRRAFFR